MNYAFLIDNRRCIGCHACSVACKAEHEVPLGVARTWVKYVDKGVFPETRRTFQVTRCNHCEDAPCVEICPTTALFRRRDGIVDFDSRRCIGCKACMQGCPYDALYIDPQTETAAKCNFCAHKVEVGLEPPCVTVCPTQAIVAGDLDDATSRIVHLTGRLPVQVRKPEKGTRPKVFYVEGDAAALVPLAAPPASDYMWAQGPPPSALSGAMPGLDVAGAPRRTYAAREQHRNSWGWKVSAYLWTKSLAAGAFLVPAVRGARAPWSEPVPLPALLVALLALAATGVLLVWDLRQPKRFLWTLTRPQWRSWLTRGSYVIAAYGLALAAQVALAVARRPVPSALIALTALLAAATATYTAFLFGQAKGRDLWQSPLLGPHLLVQALVAGAALFARPWLPVLLPISGLLVAGEVWGRHATEDARLAARLIQDDRRFTTGVLVIGHLLPLSILWGVSSFQGMAAALALFGLFVWEHLYVQAPQQVPLA
ncbi:MAG: 4Fe-4S ferredoxin [Acidobacteria bacterium]|nr:MAG: 4Fe-4S ferredoxin [Acidobacteriota bacterium]